MHKPKATLTYTEWHMHTRTSHRGTTDYCHKKKHATTNKWSQYIEGKFSEVGATLNHHHQQQPPPPTTTITTNHHHQHHQLKQQQRQQRQQQQFVSDDGVVAYWLAEKFLIEFGDQADYQIEIWKSMREEKEEVEEEEEEEEEEVEEEEEEEGKF